MHLPTKEYYSVVTLPTLGPDLMNFKDLSKSFKDFALKFGVILNLL